MNVFDNLISVDLKNDMGIVGCTDEFFCVYLYNLLKKEKKNILVVVNSLYEANKLYSSLENYTENVLMFPMDDFLTSEALAISPDLQINRLETINSLISNTKNIIITNLMGYLRYLPSFQTYKKSIISLNVGDEIDPKQLVLNLTNIGYKTETIVTKTGEVGVRGFVIDVFSVGEDNPCRIEFFGDEIDSIRYFDSNNQKSLSKTSALEIYPYWEFITEETADEEDFGKQKYLPKYSKIVSSISDYLGDSITFFKDYQQLELSYTNICNEITTYKETKDLDYDGNYMKSLVEIRNDFCCYYMSIDNILNDRKCIDFGVKTVNKFNEDVDRINTYLRKSIDSLKTVIICLKKYQIRSIVNKLNMKLYETDVNNIKIGAVNIIEKEINEGFSIGDFIFLSKNELFNTNEKKKKYKTKYKYSSKINDINKLEIGDYVVHDINGIGRYNGIKVLSMNGVEKDYLEILYQGSDKLYVPVEKIDLISKYTGKEGMVPKISKMGGAEWQKTKSRVKQKVKDMADRLLKLYAEREARRGFAFSPDSDYQLQFENDFPYELTSDQKQAIAQIKEDMEKSQPMDRLLCGDVGFGKTEVAFVAAFKAILDSKQVLFLCPTTILSSQHYKNAMERFKNYPVEIALLNRFTSPKDVKRIVDGLKIGTIDLVFGTHRLLSDDIKPKDLGLLVIDEEQRFGVMHKEKIKQFKTNVDILTLTATPIPRTLQMSITGIRSLSLIESPPVDRYPVQTYVLEENKQIIKDAIYKELSRGGQAFILYNRVESIENKVLEIKNLVPDAKVDFAHGQMTKVELENKMIDFTNHEFDCLVCTTIIETGIDIPNVNTLIILDADRFGLSQLYQIRGRVGRSDKFAYAYLMYSPQKVITETAVKRLNVIKEFTELGSGFSIATRDLSIRGAGDILGSEQAGFIDSVGIDLYLKLLNNEVSRRNGIEVKDEDEETNNKPLIMVDTHIDNSYVTDDDLKIEIHKKINEIDSISKLEEIKNEIEDRFGKFDHKLLIYMYEEWFEKLSSKIPVRQVNQTKNSIEMLFDSSVVKRMEVEDVFVQAFRISTMFRFKAKGENLLIILDTIRLEKHPLFYLTELLDYILNNLK